MPLWRLELTGPFIALYFCFFSFFVTASEKKDDNAATRKQATVRVGVLLPLSGKDSGRAQDYLSGLQMALGELAGKVGPRIELSVVDDKGETKEIARLSRELVLDKKVHVLIGALQESALQMMAPLAAEYRVPLLSVSSFREEYIEPNPYLFLLHPSNSLMARRMAAFAIQQQRSGRLALLLDESLELSVNMAKHFETAYQQLGGKGLVKGVYFSTTEDFNSVIESFKKAGVDSVFMPGKARHARLFMKQNFDLGNRWVLYGPPLWSDESFFEQGEASNIGHYFPASYTPEIKSLNNERFVELFRKQKEKDPTPMAAWGYDTFNFLLEAINSAVLPDSSISIRDSLLKLKSYEGAVAKPQFNKLRFNTQEVFVLETQSDRARLKVSL